MASERVLTLRPHVAILPFSLNTFWGARGKPKNQVTDLPRGCLDSDWSVPFEVAKFWIAHLISIYDMFLDSRRINDS